MEENKEKQVNTEELKNETVNTVNEVVDELQNSEGADIPTEVVGE